MISNKLSKLIFFFLFYLLLYGPDLKLIDIQFYTCFFIAIFGVLYYTIKNSFHKFLVLSVFILFFVFIAHLAIWPDIIFGLKVLIKFTIFLFATKFYLDLIISQNKQDFKLVDQTLLKFLFFSGFLDSIFPILFLISPEIHLIIINHLDLHMKNQLLGGFKNVRFNNLSMAGGTLSLMYLVSLISGFILLSNRRINTLTFIIGFILLLVGMILTGRIGLYLFVGVVFIFSTYHFFKKILFIKNRLNLKISSIYLIIFSLILLFYIEATYPKIFTFAFEIFNDNLFRTGSTDEFLKNHFVFNINSISNFLFGNGVTSRSDIGYINLLYTYGIFIFTYFSILYLIVFNIIFKKNFNLDNKMTIVLSKIILILYLFIFVKQTILGNEKGLVVMMMMILWSACISQRVLSKNKNQNN